MATILHVDRGGHATFYEDWDAGSSRAFNVVKDLVECLENELVSSTRTASKVVQAGGQTTSSSLVPDS